MSLDKLPPYCCGACSFRSNTQHEICPHCGFMRTTVAEAESVTVTAAEAEMQGVQYTSSILPDVSPEVLQLWAEEWVAQWKTPDESPEVQELVVMTMNLNLMDDVGLEVAMGGA